MKTKVYLFKRYERLWHWLQMTLILGLAATGFEVHGTWAALGFERAAFAHEALGLTLVVLTLFTMFWHATTGEGKQFVPTQDRFLAQVRYYTGGIFRGEHPGHVRTPDAKFNPVQRAAYFSLLIFVFPVQILAGLAVLAHRWRPDWAAAVGGLRAASLLHTAGAFAMLCFVVVHLYMLSTASGLRANLKAMLTGWHED